MNGRTSSIWYFAALLLATAAVVVTFWKVTSGRLFYYDEADYMYAGTRGFADNYLDRPSLSTIEFVRDGLQLARDRSQGSSASKFIRSSGDITFYRHYHGPIYAYWIALWHALGFHNEADYRASGLLIHALVTVLIFAFFRIAFPEYPPAAAFAAAVTFLLNRTALVAATSITQHVMFGLAAALTLFPLALFCRTGRSGYWYATAAALAIAFASVETSFILVMAVIFALGLKGLATGWKPALRLFWRGTLVFLLTMLVVWPKGVLALGGLKGYLYLAYIAVVKKTFTPISPLSLWSFKLRTYPEEFVIPILALVAATVMWRRLAARQAALPYLVYAWMFIGVTMVVTAPYTYYHVSLLVSCSVITGIMFGELWRRGIAARAIVSLVLIASLVVMNVRYYREKVQDLAVPDTRVDLVNYLRSSDHAKTYYVPAVLIPTVHFYMPDLAAVGYDGSWTLAALASAVNGSVQIELLCERQTCGAVENLVKKVRMNDSPVMAADQALQQGTLYAVKGLGI